MDTNSRIKISVINGNEDTLHDPILGRPFSHNLDRIDYTEKHNEADAILLHLDYLECDRDFNRISSTDVYKKYGDKCFCLAMHDNPNFAYRDSICTKFICQPLMGPVENSSRKIIPIPLTMRHFEYEMIKDSFFIKECRTSRKINNFCFTGQTGYANRDKIFNYNLPKFDREKTKPIWHIKNKEERIKLNKNFCKRLSLSKFSFCPRGAGSSSFRLYQSMMSGTVPIISGMEDFPFQDEVSWDSMCIRRAVDPMDLLSIDEDDYRVIRNNTINFWDQYVNIESCDKILFQKYIRNRK
jgi:hypothetical protein